MKKILRWLADRNINYKKYIIIFYTVFVVAPVLIIVSLHDTGENVFARTVASIVLLVFFVAFFIYDYRKKLADDWGVKSVTVQADGYKDICESIKTAQTVKAAVSFDIAEIYDIIEENMPKNGCRIEILLLNPYSEYAHLCGNSEYYAEYAAMFEKLASETANAIDIKYYSLMPTDNFFITDNDVFIYPMTQKLSDGRRLCKHYRGLKKAYEYYAGSFRKIWENPIYGEVNGGETDEKR